jgi:hypothetical protein
VHVRSEEDEAAKAVNDTTVLRGTRTFNVVTTPTSRLAGYSGRGVVLTIYTHLALRLKKV